MTGNNLKFLSIGLLTFSLVLLFKTGTFTKDKSTRFQVFCTSNVYGYIKPCG